MTTVLSTIPSVEAAPATAAPAESEAPADKPSGIVEAAPTEAPVSPEPEKPDPDLELAKKFDKAAKIEARARKMEAQWQAKYAELDAMKADLAAKLAEVDAALDDPIEYHLKKGKDPVEVAKRFMKPVSEEEKRIAKLEAALAKAEEERTTQAKEAESRKTQEAQQREMVEFVRGIKPDEYPHITSVYPASDIPGLVHKVLNRPFDPSDPESPTVLQAFQAKHDRNPTYKEIRDVLEHEAELYAMSLIERLRPRESAPSQVTPSTSPATEGSKSLSNQHAANSSSGASRTYSREQAMKELKEQLEAEAATD